MTDELDKKPERKIVEDGPTLMSVPMAMPQPMAVPLRQSAIPMPKYGGLLREPQLVQKNPPVKREETPRWRVQSALKVPGYYEFERTHATVESSPLEVSTRLDELFYKESIAVKYDNQEAVARAETKCSLKFAVRLWQAKANNSVVVEVQRTAGCCFMFQQAAKMIFQAAQGQSSPPKPVPRTLPNLPAVDWEKCAMEGLQLASNALSPGNRIEAHALAVEGLMQLSEAAHSRKICALHILTPESPILDSLLDIVLLHPKKAPLDSCHQSMRRYALSTLANCLESSPDLDLAGLSRLTNDETLRGLSGSFAKLDAHSQAAACRCLKALCRVDSVKNRVMELKGQLTESTQCRHLVLEEESSSLLQVL